MNKKQALFRPQKTDRRLLTLLSNVLIDSRLSAQKTGCDNPTTPTYYLGGSGSEADHSCCNHEHRRCSLGVPLQRLIMALQLELAHRLTLQRSPSRNPTSDPDCYIDALRNGLNCALKLEAQRSCGRYGHTVKIFKDTARELKFVTLEDAASEMTIELYLLLGPEYDGSKGFWMPLKYRDLLRDDGTLSFEKLVNVVWSRLQRGAITFRIWDHAGRHIVNDAHLVQSIDHAVKGGLRTPRWRVEGTGECGFSIGCFCCVYTGRGGVGWWGMGYEAEETSDPSWYGYSSEDTDYTDYQGMVSKAGWTEADMDLDQDSQEDEEMDGPEESTDICSDTYSDIYSMEVESDSGSGSSEASSEGSNKDASEEEEELIHRWLLRHPEVFERFREEC